MGSRKLILSLLFTIILLGCTATNSPRPEKSLKQLFDEGWEFYLYNQEGQYKLVLQKETETGVLILDYFNSIDKP